MAHYAFLNNENIVIKVISGKNESEEIDWEAYYSNASGLICKRTSYNTVGGIHILNGTPFRKNFAAKGYSYDGVRDAFIPPKPFASWILDENSCLWKAPINKPEDGQLYTWNEINQQWVIFSQ